MTGEHADQYVFVVYGPHQVNKTKCTDCLPKVSSELQVYDIRDTSAILFWANAIQIWEHVRPPEIYLKNIRRIYVFDKFRSVGFVLLDLHLEQAETKRSEYGEQNDHNGRQ